MVTFDDLNRPDVYFDGDLGIYRVKSHDGLADRPLTVGIAEHLLEGVAMSMDPKVRALAEAQLADREAACALVLDEEHH